MQRSFWDGVCQGAVSAFEEIVPQPERRQQLTMATLPMALLGPSLPFFVLAYLSRRADTYIIRLLIFPTAFTTTLYFTYHYKIEDHRYRMFEFIRFLSSYYIIGKSLNFALTRKGRFKIGEKRLKRVGDPESRRTVSPGSFPRWFEDGFELACTMRGIGWDFGRDVHVPPRTTSTERRQFLIDATLNLLKHFLAVDLCDSLVKLVPGVGSPEGGSMFLPDLPPHLRFSLSTAIHILGGLMVVFGLEMGNDLVGLLAVGLFRSVPASWFPLYDHPWRATSLHDFWGRRWHQILRHMFLSLGGYPGLWVGGNIGLVLGTFLASGMYHALGLQMADHRIVLFFVLQGLGILLENVYRRCTGRRVGGVAGWCWTAFWVVVLGQMCTDAWSIGGLPGAILVPRKLSIARRFGFPALRYLARCVVSHQ
ncbi:hypothetical protein C8Q72DRAFT_192133 [Fomitopsis betulina]|nr:hypothetical protein C8Q72DRAFT_192133 [Fomitopsis betulina]